MDKLIGVIVILGLVLFLYLNVFQTGVADSITNKGTDVESTIDGTNVSTP